MGVDSCFIDNIQIVKGADYEAEFVDCFDLTDLEIVGTIYDNDTEIAEIEFEKISSTAFNMKLSNTITSAIATGEYNYSCHLVGDTISPAFLKGKVFVIKESNLT